ncbi:hypothetical protein [Alkalihalobacillus pseudalcaliphilus]|uniref:hypothetical protein n=1 Tax=Alkalihalobacillus pseudalcaliphilus TaxID=79884 RepID=UPI00064D9383|nr:hypothetical protein [Alkalihalobacillus pseudalcaliphilus]KMK75936.1 hypothetical protein AB990_11840 [Alkalihalobacillus pseudalcaliphilus]
MKKFLIYTCLFTFVLAFGLLAGVQYMNEQAGRSTPVPLKNNSEEKSHETHEKEQKEETKVGQVTKTGANEDLLEKRAKREELGSFNFFSDLGEQLSTSFNKGSRVVLESVMGYANQLFTGVVGGGSAD